MSLTESIVEDAALTWFGELGYCCLGVQALTSTLSQGERESYGEVVRSRFARTLTRHLPEGEEKREALQQIHPKIPDEAREKALRKGLRMDVPWLVAPTSSHPAPLPPWSARRCRSGWAGGCDQLLRTTLQVPDSILP